MSKYVEILFIGDGYELHHFDGGIIDFFYDRSDAVRFARDRGYTII